MHRAHLASCFRIAAAARTRPAVDRMASGEAGRAGSAAPAPVPGARASLGAQLLAGSLSGLLGDVVTHPVNTAQTRLQAGRGVSLRPARLYRGFGIVALFSVPSHGLYFAVYDRLRHVSAPAAGAAAELAGAALLTPSEVLKKRAQLGHARYAGALPGLLVAVAADLARAPAAATRDLYAGLGLSCAVWVPFSAVYFGAYERLRARGAPTWAAAAAGGGAAAVATAPLDVVLTRLQTRHAGARTFAAALRGVARDRAWLNGVGARVLWLAPSACISLTAYEALVPRVEAWRAGGGGGGGGGATV